jgi:hypothetical protein
MSGAVSAIRDLLSLLHEEWIRKEVIKQMLVDMVDRMEDSTSMQDLR